MFYRLLENMVWKFLHKLKFGVEMYPRYPYKIIASEESCYWESSGCTSDGK